MEEAKAFVKPEELDGLERLEKLEKLQKMKRQRILIGCTLAVAVGVFGYWFYQNNQAKPGLEFEDNAILGMMPGIDMDARLKELQDKLDESMIAFSINSNPSFANGISMGNVMIENPEHNAKLLVAEIYLDAGNELLYKTKFIKPGSYIQSIKLDKELPKGSYPATVYFKAYSEDGSTFIGQTGAQITIHIQA